DGRRARNRGGGRGGTLAATWNGTSCARRRAVRGVTLQHPGGRSMRARAGLVNLTVVLGFIGLIMLIVVVGYVLRRSGGRAVPVVQEVTFDAGVPGRGRELIEAYGCVTCHEVPGTRGLGGQVGPPLTD